MTREDFINIAEKRLLTVTNRPPVIMERGHGMHLFDTEGNRYLDFIGGWAVNSLGHSPEALAKALSHQAETLVNASPSFYNRPMIEYADELVRQSCFDRVFFTSTGAEANEGAIKLARKYGKISRQGASEIITTWNSFHGRTLATMAATGKKHWEPLFEPKAKGFARANFNDLAAAEQAVSEQTCAIMIEPVQGEGGVNVASREFVAGLRDICNRHGILLIFDEVQTGMGRTGKLFCYQHYGVEPDIMTLGKGIGGGFPLAAMLCKEELNIFEPGDQGGTYTGQPLAMAVGRAVLKELLERRLPEHSNHMGVLLSEQLNRLAETSEITNIRGLGLLVAFDCTISSAHDVVKACLADGLIINAPSATSIRLIPPLIVGPDDIARCLDILGRHLAPNRP